MLTSRAAPTPLTLPLNSRVDKARARNECGGQSASNYTSTQTTINKNTQTYVSEMRPKVMSSASDRAALKSGGQSRHREPEAKTTCILHPGCYNFITIHFRTYYYFTPSLLFANDLFATF